MANDESGVGLSLRELLLEVRADVKALDDKIDHIDRHGPIGTREEITDHETRIRRVEAWVYAIPVAAIIAVGGVATTVVQAIL